MRTHRIALFLLIASLPLGARSQTTPIAIVPVEGVKLSGGMDIANGKAVIANSGSVTAGDHAATITLPHRGNLRLCPTTQVSLTADASVAASVTPAGATPGNPVTETPGIMMALGQGAIEANFSTGTNSDVILTPDFRIVISGPGTAEVHVRLGDKGDTCVDNRGPNAPYVTVSSIFEGGVYRVQADQRVMFQHGSLREVVDREKESCGCPIEAAPSVTGNDFPVAQSAGLAPLPPAPPNAVDKGVVQAQATVQLGYDGSKPAQDQASATVKTPPLAAPPPEAVKPPPQPGFFRKVGRFFRKVFGG